MRRASGGMVAIALGALAVCTPLRADPAAAATSRTVTTLADSGTGSLREAIALSGDGDVIDFAVSGTITLTSGQLAIDNDLRIEAAPGTVTVSGNNASRIFDITSGQVAITGLALIDGHVAGTQFAVDSAGGAIRNAGTLSLTDCTIASSEAVSTGSNPSAGGGIFTVGGLTIERCLLDGNTAFATASFLGGLGGAIYNHLGEVTLDGSTIIGNSVTRNNPDLGGSGGSGGAIVNTGTLTLSRSTVAGNSATLVGGGLIDLTSSGSGTTVVNSTFTTNTARGGGAIWVQGSTTLVNATVSGNTATNGGGGGVTTFTPAVFLNTIVAGNSASAGQPDVSSSGAVDSRGHNLIGITDGSSGWGPTDLTGTGGAPLDPKLGPPLPNGGPTVTMALIPGSPAIDAADDAVLGPPHRLDTDQRAEGFPRQLGSHVDIGAFEAEAPQPGPRFLVNRGGDADDGVCGFLDCGLREAVRAANDAAGADTVTFAPTVRGTIKLVNGQLDIAEALTLRGPGPDLLTIDGDRKERVFRVNAPGQPVAISGLTITRGRMLFTVDPWGGGIANNAMLTLSDCTISDNQAWGAQGDSGNDGWPAQGGGVYNTGTLTVNDCTFHANIAIGGAGSPGGSFSAGDGGPGQGGGVYNTGTLTMRNCTLSENDAQGGTGGDPFGTGGTGQGAGVYNAGEASVVSCTISGNRSTAGTFGGAGIAGGLFQAATGSASVRNTLLAGNVAFEGSPDAMGTFTSLGYNLVGAGDGAVGFTDGVEHDQVGSSGSPLDPMIGPLADNGGSTPTRALLHGSPAIDQGETGLARDQRGQPRPYDDPAVANAGGGQGDDVGAFERQRAAFYVGDVRVVEGTSGTVDATFTVTLLDPDPGPSSVMYATGDGTATAPRDYVALPLATLPFASGQTTATVTVPVKGDVLDESNERFTVDLSAPTNASLGDRKGNGTIVDDDLPPVVRVGDISVSEGDGDALQAAFRVSLSAASGRAVTVRYATVDGTAVAPGDYEALPLTTLQFDPGQTTRTVQVSVRGDRLDEADETFGLLLSAPTNVEILDGDGVATIADNDATPRLRIGDATVTEGDTGTRNAAFSVTLSARSGRAVSVQYATADGSAVAPGDYTALAATTLIFDPGQTAKTIRVAVRGDGRNELLETFLVNLSSPVGVTVEDSQGLGTIEDDDPRPALSVDDVAVVEGDGGTVEVTFRIRLSAASGKPVTVQYATADGTAVAPGDYTAVPPTAVTFAPGQTVKTVKVTVKGDQRNEPDETFSLNLSAPTNATIADGKGVGTITDDE